MLLLVLGMLRLHLIPEMVLCLTLNKKGLCNYIYAKGRRVLIMIQILPKDMI